MKRPSATACLALGGAMLASLSSTPASGRDYYMMICRTGGEMSGAIPASGVAGVPSDQTVISISFRKASAAYSASADTTRPGECAWTDRAINTSEPDNIRFSLNTRLRVTFRNTDREALVFDSVGTEGGTQVNTIMKTLMEGDYFWFEATNANASRYNYFNARNFSAGRPRTGSVRVR